MSRGGASPAYHPTGSVYLTLGNCTIRWQRGDKVAYLFEGKQLESRPGEILKMKLLGTIPVLSQGWTDLAEVKRAGEKWVKVKRECGQADVVYS